MQGLLQSFQKMSPLLKNVLGADKVHTQVAQTLGYFNEIRSLYADNSFQDGCRVPIATFYARIKFLSDTFSLN